MICSHCSTENDIDSVFCRNCGNKLFAVKISDNRIEVNDNLFDMISVKGGTFLMGNSSGLLRQKSTLHKVTISDFKLSSILVTQKLWETVMGFNTRSSWSKNTGDSLPVENVSWYDCIKFIERLNKLTHMNFRLPTEAEWEFAARGGIFSRGYKYSGSDRLSKVAARDHWNYKTLPVGTKMPNELGIYDMSGNLWEWCNDWYGEYTTESVINPHGPKSGKEKVMRGGCAWSDDECCRVYYRSSSNPDSRNDAYGFRLAL